MGKGGKVTRESHLGKPCACNRKEKFMDCQFSDGPTRYRQSRYRQRGKALQEIDYLESSIMEGMEEMVEMEEKHPRRTP